MKKAFIIFLTCCVLLATGCTKNQQDPNDEENTQEIEIVTRDPNKYTDRHTGFSFIFSPKSQLLTIDDGDYDNDGNFYILSNNTSKNQHSVFGVSKYYINNQNGEDMYAVDISTVKAENIFQTLSYKVLELGEHILSLSHPKSKVEKYNFTNVISQKPEKINNYEVSKFSGDFDVSFSSTFGLNKRTEYHLFIVGYSIDVTDNPIIIYAITDSEELLPEWEQTLKACVKTFKK